MSLENLVSMVPRYSGVFECADPLIQMLVDMFLILPMLCLMSRTPHILTFLVS